MKCMKCGKKYSAEQVFCDDCLAEMEKYPVSPETPIVLPPKANAEPVKHSASSRKLHRDKDTISVQRNWMIFLITMCGLLAIALTIAVSMLLGGDPMSAFDFLYN